MIHNMRISLKQFALDPYKTISKTPVIVELSGRPRYVIIPYEEYKAKFVLEHPAIKPTAHWWDSLFK
jgi:hypothetical protein